MNYKVTTIEHFIEKSRILFRKSTEDFDPIPIF